MNQKKVKLLTEQEVSELTGRSLDSLRNDRWRNQGIPYIKIGRQVRYDYNDIIQYLNDNRIDFKDD